MNTTESRSAEGVVVSATQLRQGYTNVLLEHVKETRFPSRELMDRIEFSLRDYNEAIGYLEVLIDKVQNKYPSLELLDRINNLLLRLEATDMQYELMEAQSDNGRR